MRWPIRNQILLPFVVIQVIATLAVAAASAVVSVRTVEREIRHRLVEVERTLESAWYPLTPEILGQLSRLSGADFVVLDSTGSVVSSTTESSGVIDPETLTAVRSQALPAGTSDSTISSRTLIPLDGRQYFAAITGQRWRQDQLSVLILYPVSTWQTVRHQALLPPLTIGLALLIVTVLAAVWIARRLSGRIQVVQDQVTGIAAGNFQPWPLVAADDELRDLGVSVNRMAVVVEESMRNVRTMERSSLLTQLVGGLSHQIRNALTGARTCIQLHQRHCSHADDKAIDVAMKQLALTEQQIRSLLRLSRGERDVPQPASLQGVLQETIALVAPTCVHRRVTLSCDSAPPDVRIPDGDGMRGALLNLLMNAIEAAGPSGAIDVRTVAASNGVTIEIADSGAGIREEHLTDIFVPFFTTKAEGAGLGLTLAQSAALSNGGSLSVRRDNGMTVFAMTLPVWHEDDARLSLSREKSP